MSTFEYEDLSPPDAITAVRSLPRRFAEALAPVDEADAQTLLRPGSAGVSAAGYAARAAAAMRSTAEDLESVLHHDSPTISGGPSTGEPDSVDAALVEVETAAAQLAKVAQAYSADDWNRTGSGSAGPVSAAQLLRHAVSFAVGQLRQIDDVRAETRAR